MDATHPRPPAYADIHLHPGEWTIASGPVVVRTLLGSCVALTLWHPPTRIGGMCHYLLPVPPQGAPVAVGRYGSTVFAHLMAALEQEGVPPERCEAKLFGGGNMLDSALEAAQVGQRNIEIARALLMQRGVPLLGEDCGGYGHRTVLFELWSGHVWVRHTDQYAVTRGES